MARGFPAGSLIHRPNAVWTIGYRRLSDATLHQMTRTSLSDEQPRFMPLSDVAKILNISVAQAYALVRNKELPAIKIGGRGQWRVETSQLEAYISRAYDETRAFLDKHPFGKGEDEDEDDTEPETEPAHEDNA